MSGRPAAQIAEINTGNDPFNRRAYHAGHHEHQFIS
jgi:hypothetical protein